ncbi:MAG: hypothetical protein J0H40_00135 [Rhizobiales bacterium]|nr:hypothetical protein [Hyphomicrobiales bacterium]
MQTTLVLLALAGFAVGAFFRLASLLFVLVILLLLSILFSVIEGFSFIDTLVAIIVTQSVVQASYVLGLAAQPFLAPNPRRIL